MMTRSEGKLEDPEESYEEAPYEKSQNEGLNLIQFRGNNMGDSDAEEIENEEHQNNADGDEGHESGASR